MNEQPIDYQSVLKDLLSKRASIDAAIDGVRSVLSMSQTNAPAGSAMSAPSAEEQSAPANSRQAPTQIQSADQLPYSRMTIVDAAIDVLRREGRDMRIEEVTEAIRSGGASVTDNSPTNVVGSILNRNYQNGGVLVRAARGTWGLTDWHPGLQKKQADASGGATESAATTNAQTKGFFVL